MALNTTLSNAQASVAADAVCANANSGFLDIYDGTQPATADTAITTQNKLASLTFNATAFGAASNGVATANAITSDSSADFSGTATWFRCFKSNHTSVLFDGSVGTSGANLNLLTTTIVATQAVSVTAFTYTQKKVE